MTIKKISHFLNFIKTNYNYLHKEVKPKYLFYGQLQKKRERDMLENLNIKNNKFKNLNINDSFVFVEIGSYLGESLKLFGNEINKQLKNFIVISIDPYSSFINKKDDKEDKMSVEDQTKTTYKMDKNISKIYNYFLNNVSTYSFNDNHFHLKMTSDNDFELLKKINIKINFFYIDGLHYYENIKRDYSNYLSILKSENNYNGMICGDDYELEFNKFDKILDITKSEFAKILNDNKSTDYIFLNTKSGVNIKNKIGFHPGLTLFFSEIKDNIKKYDSGFWKKTN